MIHPNDLLIVDKSLVAWEDLVISPENEKQLEQLIKEQRFVDALQEYGLPVNHKILLHGSSGCGKTMTAKALAKQLSKPLYILNLSTIVNARIGETSQNLKGIFDRAARDKAILFLDEFDQIGKARGSEDKDVGEMRRLVNTLIQLIDYLPEKTLLICATNHIDVLDKALVRRFQLRIRYEMPDPKALDIYYDKLLATFPVDLAETTIRNYGLSYAEAKDDIYTQLKANLLARLVKEEELTIIM